MPEGVGFQFWLDVGRPFIDRPHFVSARAAAKFRDRNHNQITQFHGRYIPRDIRLEQMAKPFLHMHLEMIEALTSPDDALFVPPKTASLVPRRIHESGLVVPGKVAHWTHDEYPPIAIKHSIQGLVLVRGIIGLDGTLADVQAVAGAPELAKSAVETLRYYRFEPSRLDGQPMEMDALIQFTYRLSR